MESTMAALTAPLARGSSLFVAAIAANAPGSRNVAAAAALAAPAAVAAPRIGASPLGPLVAVAALAKVATAT